MRSRPSQTLFQCFTCWTGQNWLLWYIFCLLSFFGLTVAEPEHAHYVFRSDTRHLFIVWAAHSTVKAQQHNAIGLYFFLAQVYPLQEWFLSKTIPTMSSMITVHSWILIMKGLQNIHSYLLELWIQLPARAMKTDTCYTVWIQLPAKRCLRINRNDKPLFSRNRQLRK